MCYLKICRGAPCGYPFMGENQIIFGGNLTDPIRFDNVGACGFDNDRGAKNRVVGAEVLAIEDRCLVPVMFGVNRNGAARGKDGGSGRGEWWFGGGWHRAYCF